MTSLDARRRSSCGPRLVPLCIALSCLLIALAAAAPAVAQDSPDGASATAPVEPAEPVEPAAPTEPAATGEPSSAAPAEGDAATTSADTSAGAAEGATAPNAGDGGGEDAATSATAVDPLFEIDVSVQGPPARAPMAVVDPTDVGADGDSDGVGQGIAEVIRRDFEMSGLFEVTSPSTYASMVDLKQDGVTVSTVDFDGWYLVGASLLVKGTYAISGSQVEIDLRLFNIDEGTRVDINWSATTVRKSSYRSVAHDFVNAVIEHYTGERGIFGTRMLFTAPDTGNGRRIYSVDNAGFGLARYKIADGINVLPSWGERGSVYFTSLTDDGDNLHSFRKGETTQLTDVTGYASGAAYCSSKGIIALTVSTDDGTDIYTMAPDGSELTNITNTPEIIETSPSWGPGCKKMAYVSDESGRPQIYVMRADGDGVRRLTWAGNYNTTPDWSPKGDLVAFTARDERRRFDIFTVEVSSGHITRLTQDQGNNEEPTFAPDGRYLGFQSTRDGRQPRLYMMTADGRWQTRVTDMPGARTPVWKR